MGRARKSRWAALVPPLPGQEDRPRRTSALDRPGAELEPHVAPGAALTRICRGLRRGEDTARDHVVRPERRDAGVPRIRSGARVAWAEAAKASEEHRRSAEGPPLRAAATRRAARGRSRGRRVDRPPHGATGEATHQVRTCALPLRRALAVKTEYQHGDPLAQTHRVSALDDAGSTRADGTIRDRVYSAARSAGNRMRAAGVRCASSTDHDSQRCARRATASARGATLPTTTTTPGASPPPADAEGGALRRLPHARAAPRGGGRPPRSRLPRAAPDLR